MIEDRFNRTAADAGGAPTSLPRRVRTWLGLSGEPRLRHPHAARIEPIRRTWIAAFLQARVSVAAGVPLDDWLRSRLARYLSALPVARARLPLSIEVDDGELRVTATESERRPAGPVPADQDAWLAPLVAAEGPGARQEVSELEVRLAVLDGDAEGARKRSEELSRRLAADVASGMVPAPSGVEATAEQLGRPVIRSAGPMLVVGAFAVLAVAAETWQIAAPLLRSVGVEPARFAVDSAQRPLEAIFATAFALGVSVALFALSHTGLEAALIGYRGEDDARRRWLGAAGAGAAALAGLVAGAVASLPAPKAALPPWTLVLLLVSLPLATALMLRRARGWAAAREAEVAAALAWDRERARALADRARRLEELDWAEDEERAIERQREASRRRLREISARAIEAARVATEAERRERAALARLAQSLVGALELDRFEFVRQASGRGAVDLVAPRRRKPAEARPQAVVEPAPTASPSAVAATVIEAGRLAS